MRKLLISIIFTTLSFANSLQISTLLPITANLVNEIGDEDIKATSLIEFKNGFASSSVEEYKVRPYDIKRAKKADYIMSFEVFKNRNNVGKIFGSKTIYLDKGIDYMKDGDEINSHIFLSVKNLKIIAKNIRDNLVKLNSNNKDKITSNYNKLISKLDKIDESMRDSMQGKSIASFHNAFAYIKRDYSMNFLFLDTEGGTFSLKSLQSFKNSVKKYKLTNIIDIKEEIKAENSVIAKKLGLKDVVISVIDGDYNRLFRNIKQGAN